MRKIFSLFAAILFAGSMMATLPTSPTWEAKALANITDGSTLIIISNSTTATNVALPSTTTTSANPKKVICELETTDGVTTITAPEGYTLQDLAWTLVKSGDNFKFYQEGSEEIRMYLTGLSTNTGLRISNANSANDEFVMGDLGQLLKVTTGPRFVGPYDNNGSDWRTYNTENATNYKGAALTFYVLKPSETPSAKYYMKNNWGAGADWTWKEMTKDGDNYKLENVVFGGTGVNYNTAESDEGASWVALADIAGDAIAAKDTVNFVLNPTASTVTATLVGKYVNTEGTKYYMKNNWDAGADWTWKEMTQDGDNYKLENVIYGGTGVNYNTAADDASATWVPEASILGDALAAKDTVNLVLNPTAGTVTATIVGKYAESGEPEKTLPVVALAGTMNGWSTTANVLVAAKDSLTASVTVALEAGKDTFKIVSDGKWLSLNGEGETLYGFHREWTTASHINGVDLRNFELTADVAGDYTFTWTYADSTLAITFPEKPAEVDPDQMYIWNGNGVTKADDAIELGGAAEAVQTSGTNIVVGASQKGNWCLKVNKGFSNGEYYVGIAMDNAVNAGDTVKIAYFRTSSSATYVLGMDFSADKESAATTYKILTTGDPQYLGSNGVPADSVFIVPEGVANAKYMRIYRNTGSTGLWVSKVEIVKKSGDAPIVVPAKYYITGDSALVTDAGFAGKAWNPDAIKAEADTMELTLKAEQAYKLKVTLDGTWGDGKVKGFSDLTQEDKTGLSADADNNICFSLTEAGKVTVVYKEGAFTVTGKFYVAPVPVPAKYYITGDSAMLADAAGDATLAWNPAAIKAEADTMELTLKADQAYKLKVTLDGTWGDGKVKGFSDLTQEDKTGLSADADNNICFSLTEAGKVTVVYKEGAFTVTGKFYVAPVPVAHYYIAGTMTDWKCDSIELVPLDENVDSLGAVLNLKADSLYQLKAVRIQGTDTAWYGLNEFATMTYGNSTGWYIYKSAGEANQANVGLKTTKEGAYAVELKVAEDHLEISVVIPEPEPVDPTVVVRGTMTDPAWVTDVPFVLAQDKKSASMTANIKKGEYQFKMVINGEWRSNGYTFHRDFTGAAGITGNTEAEMTFKADIEGQYTFTWTFANDSLEIVYPEKPAPVLANGYYLVGNKYNWTPAAERQLIQNPENLQGLEYMIADVTLAADDSLKVVYVEDDDIKTWYPAGDNYVVDANHAGTKTIYFRPNADGGEGWFAGTIYIEANGGGTAIINTEVEKKAVKTLRNGILVIEKNGKAYNVIGLQIR